MRSDRVHGVMPDRPQRQKHRRAGQIAEAAAQQQGQRHHADGKEQPDQRRRQPLAWPGGHPDQPPPQPQQRQGPADDAGQWCQVGQDGDSRHRDHGRGLRVGSWERGGLLRIM